MPLSSRPDDEHCPAAFCDNFSGGKPNSRSACSGNGVGVSKTSVSTIEPLDEPNETLQKEKTIHCFFSSLNSKERKVFNDIEWKKKTWSFLLIDWNAHLIIEKEIPKLLIRRWNLLILFYIVSFNCKPIMRHRSTICKEIFFYSLIGEKRYPLINFRSIYF